MAIDSHGDGGRSHHGSIKSGQWRSTPFTWLIDDILHTTAATWPISDYFGARRSRATGDFHRLVLAAPTGRVEQPVVFCFFVFFFFLEQLFLFPAFVFFFCLVVWN
jgi:hypothetical protein